MARLAGSAISTTVQRLRGNLVKKQTVALTRTRVQNEKSCSRRLESIKKIVLPAQVEPKKHYSNVDQDKLSTIPTCLVVLYVDFFGF